MTTIEQRTNELFLAATMSNDDLGYPNGVEFVPGDQEWADDAVWRSLAEEGRPVVVVGDEIEVLLVPHPRTLIDRLVDHVRVTITQRANGHESQFATRSTLGRHPVRQMRDLAHA